MFGRLLLKHRVNKMRKRYTPLSYEIRPRVQATALVELINPEWVKETYTLTDAHDYVLNVRSTDPSRLIHNLEKVLGLITERKDIDDRYKVSGLPRRVTLDAWLEDSDRRAVSPYVVTKELKRLIPQVSRELAECELAREDLYDYYQLSTLAYMEDAAEFLEAILSLKLNK